MKVIKVVLLVLTLGFGSAFTETNSSLATIINGGPQTIHNILAINPGMIAVVGDFEYFLNCSKYKIDFERVQMDPEAKKHYTYPSCFSASKVKTC